MSFKKKMFSKISQKSQKNTCALQFCWNRTSAWVFSYEFAAYFQNIFSQEHLAEGLPVNFAKFLRTPFYRRPPEDCFSKAKFFSLFSLSFSNFGNYQLNWKCENMKLNSWKFLQISWHFLTFTWFNEYFEWIDRYMNFLPLRTKV